MRDPVLYDYSEYRTNHNLNLDLNKTECENCHGHKSEEIQEPICVTRDFEVGEPNKEFISKNELIWSSYIKIDSKTIDLRLEKVPYDDKELFSKLGSDIIRLLESFTDENIQEQIKISANDWETPSEPRFKDPVLTIDDLKDILKSVGFVFDNNGKRATHKEIGSLEFKESDSIKFSDGFNVQDFNNTIKNELDNQASEWYSDLQNPYDTIFNFRDISSFFVKHKKTGRELWKNYNHNLFVQNPLTADYVEFEHLIDDNTDRYEYLSAWSDLLRLIEFQTVDLSVDKTKSTFKDLISDTLGQVESSDVFIPWHTRSYRTVREDIVKQYNPTDFDYDKDGLHDGLEVSISETEHVDIIFEVVKYGRFGGLCGEIVPKGWLVEPIATLPSDNEVEITRCDLYEVLEEKRNLRYLRNGEIEDLQVCSESQLTPVVRKDGSYDRVKRKLNKYDDYKNRIKRAVSDGYDMKTVELSDFFDTPSWSDGFVGWHTGTVCAEFPFKARIDSDGSFKSYQEFRESGSISYKTSDNIVIKPDWGSIIESTKDPSELSEEELREAVSKSRYSLGNKAVVTFHRLP